VRGPRARWFASFIHAYPRFVLEFRHPVKELYNIQIVALVITRMGFHLWERCAAWCTHHTPAAQHTRRAAQTKTQLVSCLHTVPLFAIERKGKDPSFRRICPFDYGKPNGTFH
jgi:hypothetical protein